MPGAKSAAYAQRWPLDLTLPLLTNRRLDVLLGVRPGGRLLEVGPGTGLQALDVVGVLDARGRLDSVDIQQPMLDHVMRRRVGRWGIDTEPARYRRAWPILRAASSVS